MASTEIPFLNAQKQAAAAALKSRGMEWAMQTRPELQLQRDPLSVVDFSKARQLIDENRKVYALNGSRHLAREYWAGARNPMPATDINSLVDAESHLIFHVPDETIRSILERGATEPLAAGLQLIDALAPLYDPNGYSLSASIQGETPDGKQKGIDGFNDHRRPHIRTVLRGALALLDQAKALGFRTDITPQVRQVTANGVAIHDGINIFGRGIHATGIPILFPYITPELASSPLWHDIVKVGVFHNEPQLTELLHTLPADHTLTDEIDMLASLGPEVLTTVLADKLHIGQDRLPPEWRHSDGLLRDWNIAVNACFRTDEAEYTQDGKTFRVNMSYTAGPENDRSHPATIAEDGQPKDRFWMPKAIDAYMRESDPEKRVAHSEVVEAMMWQTYRDRLRLTILSAFAYNPQAETVEINIADNNAREALQGYLSPERIEQVAHRSYRFTRGNVDKALDALLKEGDNGKFWKMGVRLKDLKRQGEGLLPVASSSRRQPVTA